MPTPTLPPLPEAAGTIPLEDVIIDERVDRDASDPVVAAHIEELARQFSDPTIGLINPITIDTNNRLIAGWCRLQALAKAGYDVAPYNVIAGRDLVDALVLQYEENDARLDISWQGRARHIAQVHRAAAGDAARKGQDWTQFKTGQLLSGARQHGSKGFVSNCLLLASAIEAGNTYIATAPSVSEAMKRYYDQIGQAAQEALAARTDTNSTEALIGSSPPPPIPKRTQTSGGPSTLPDTSPTPPPTSTGIPEPTKLSLTGRVAGALGVGEVKEVTLTSRLFQGKMQEVGPTKLKAGSIDLIVTDIPYGADMEVMAESMDDIEHVMEEHKFEDWLLEGPEWFKEMYRVLADKSFCVVFYDPWGMQEDKETKTITTHDSLVKTWANQAGFRICRYPIVWHKMHPCPNRTPQYWWTNCTENMLVLRKGTATMQNTDYAPNVFQAANTLERKRSQHPFCKPFEFLSYVMQKISYRGMSLYDPFMGEGSILAAGVKHGLVPYGCELSEKWYPRAINRLKETYEEMYGTVNFIG